MIITIKIIIFFFIQVNHTIINFYLDAQTIFFAVFEPDFYINDLEVRAYKIIIKNILNNILLYIQCN